MSIRERESEIDMMESIVSIETTRSIIEELHVLKYHPSFRPFADEGRLLELVAELVHYS